MPTTKLVTRTNVRDLSPKGTNRVRDYRRFNSSLWTQSVIRLRRSEKLFSFMFYRGMAL